MKAMAEAAAAGAHPLAQQPAASEPALVAGPTESPEETAPALSRESIAARLLALVSDRTGYPEEMLEFHLDLEADLSIDSIKRVEIFGALQDEAGFEDSSADIETLAKLKTLGQIVDWLASGGESGPALTPAPVEEPAVTAQARPVAETPASPPKQPDSHLVRQGLRLETAPALPPAQEWSLDGCVLILDDGCGSADRLAERLEALGAVTETFPYDIRNERSASELVNGLRGRRGQISALVTLAPLAAVQAEDLAQGFRDRLDTELLTLLNVARFVETDLRESGGKVLSASRMGGGYGIDMPADALWWPGAGAIGGFVKSLAREWPEVSCRTVDFEADAPLEQTLDEIIAELLADDDLLEVGYRQGERLTLGVEEAPIDAPGDESPLEAHSVVLVTGGGGGINAETAIALARHSPARFIVTGRSALVEDEERPAIAAATTARDLKAALIEQCRAEGRKPVPIPALQDFVRGTAVIDPRDHRTALLACHAECLPQGRAFHSLDLDSERRQTIDLAVVEVRQETLDDGDEIM